MQNDTILETIDPEIVDRLVSRREAIRQGATVSSGVAAALALGSVPVALAVLSREAKAQTSTVVDVLNFALALEIFENEFYKAVLGTSSSATQNGAFAPVRALAAAVPTAVASIQQIQKHEAAHVATSGVAVRAGIRTVKPLPSPGRLSTPIEPPWSWAIRRANRSRRRQPICAHRSRRLTTSINSSASSLTTI